MEGGITSFDVLMVTDGDEHERVGIFELSASKRMKSNQKVNQFAFCLRAVRKCRCRVIRRRRCRLFWSAALTYNWYTVAVAIYPQSRQMSVYYEKNLIGLLCVLCVKTSGNFNFLVCYLKRNSESHSNRCGYNRFERN